MKTGRTIIKYWCISGVVIITLSGILLHYLYHWSGGNRVLGSIAPVNESIWEHLKLGYWGLFLFSVPEFFYIKPKVSNYFFAKLSGVFAIEICILLIHYTYTLFTGYAVLWADISSFVLGVIACQYLIYKIYLKPGYKKKREWICLGGFTGLGVLFVIMTYYPPNYEIFRDKKNNIFGIDKTG